MSVGYQERYGWLLTQLVDTGFPFDYTWGGVDYPEWFIRELAERHLATDAAPHVEVDLYLWAVRAELGVEAVGE